MAIKAFTEILGHDEYGIGEIRENGTVVQGTYLEATEISCETLAQLCRLYAQAKLNVEGHRVLELKYVVTGEECSTENCNPSDLEVWLLGEAGKV